MALTPDDVKATVIAAPAVALVITALRLFERIRTRKFGWDDGFALLAAVMLLVFSVGMNFKLMPDRISRSTSIALYYVLSQLFYSILWSARLSILFSIVRITPTLMMRRILYGVAVSFFICWAILFAQNFWFCEAQRVWKEAPFPICVLGINGEVPIAQVITDVYADVCLIAFPVKLLWNLRASRAQRVRLLLIFSTSIITTIVSLVHSYYVLRVGGFPELISAIVENSVSLIVCNMAVVVPMIMRFFKWGGGEEPASRVKPYAPPPRSPSQAGEKMLPNKNQSVDKSGDEASEDMNRPESSVDEKHHSDDTHRDMV